MASLFSFQALKSRPLNINIDASINNNNNRRGSRPSIKPPKTPGSPFDPLSAALSSVQEKYTISNAKSLAAHNDACENFPGGNTRTVLHSSPFPMTFVSGRGCELTSLDGDVYVDFLGEFTAGIYGHSNKAIALAITDAMNAGWNFGGPNPYERELARKVCKRFAPSGVELVRFTNSGTESNTMAIAAAVAFTRRKKVVVFRNGYHGGTLYFPANLNPNMNTNLPHDFVIAPYNDIEGTKAILAAQPPESVAAILVEPVQGSGGSIPGTEAFLKYLNTTAHTLGALFIVDEVMTSRLSYNGLSSELGLRPDLVTLGKWIGGGMTFGAFGGTKSGGIMALFDPRGGILSHSGTFNNNIVTMAAGCAGLDIYTEAEVRRLNKLGDDMRESLAGILEKYKIKTPQPNKSFTEENELESPFTGLSIAATVEKEELQPKMWVSGRGSMLNVHFSGESEGSLKSLFWHHMLDHGIYLAQRGFIALNMEMQPEHIDRFVDAVEKFVGKYRQALTS